MATSCGAFHSAAVSRGGTLWIWGDGAHGRLGLGDRRDRTEPAPIEAARLGGSKAVMVSCGQSHSAAVNSRGNLYLWGDGYAGALGQGDDESSLLPLPITTEHLCGQRVLMVACGEDYTAAVACDFSLWTWGEGENGRLGHGDTETRFRPCRIAQERFAGTAVCFVAAGSAHTAAVTSDHNLWTWGAGVQGALGLNGTRPRHAPTHVKSMVGVVQVSCGGDHTAAVDVENNVWTWGLGDGGQLGHGDRKNRHLPAKIGHQRFASHQACAAQVSCGGDYTAVVTNQGALWVFGSGDGGQLGLGDTVDRLWPSRVAAKKLGGARAVTCSAGHGFLAAVTEVGELFMWGKAGQGQLGVDPIPEAVSYCFSPFSSTSRKVNIEGIGCCTSIPPSHALAFAMSGHPRLARDSLFFGLLPDLVQRVVEAGKERAEGQRSEMQGLMRLLQGALAPSIPLEHSHVLVGAAETCDGGRGRG